MARSTGESKRHKRPLRRDDAVDREQIKLIANSFYYADERTAEGGAMYGDIGGDAHAKFFLQLAQKEVRVPWHATFVKGKGYVKFTD